MLEAKVRKVHRTVGIYLAGFLALQAITGLFIALWTLTGVPGDGFWFRVMTWIHHQWNPVGSVYRILLGALVTGQGLGGLAIYLLMRSRQNKF
jgi:uncharacterized iron-regulated membrane protein